MSDAYILPLLAVDAAALVAAWLVFGDLGLVAAPVLFVASVAFMHRRSHG